MNKTIATLIKTAKKDSNVLAIAFFGSYARGEKNPRDIDICIFLNPGTYSNLDLSKIKLKYTPIEEKYDLQIFQQLPLYVQEEIMKDAVFLFIKDPDTLYNLFRSAHREFEDFKPHYEAYLEGLRNAI